MATGSVPNVGTRVNLQMFAADLLAHQGLITVESYPNLEDLTTMFSTAVFSDGAGVHVAFSGERSSVRMVLAAALSQLGPEVEVNPEPPEE